jgi:hypothetical protein
MGSRGEKRHGDESIWRWTKTNRLVATSIQLRSVSDPDHRPVKQANRWVRAGKRHCDELALFVLWQARSDVHLAIANCAPGMHFSMSDAAAHPALPGRIESPSAGGADA